MTAGEGDKVNVDIFVIGGGPAGLMAAETASARGLSVCIAERNPSLGRKLLMAGKSGLNLTKDEPLDLFLSRYHSDEIHDFVRSFPPSRVIEWANGLGVECFTGSSGKVFPKAMKASPLLRAWLARLAAQNVMVKTRWQWVGERPDDLRFQTPDGDVHVEPKAVIYALGGASWSRLGSTGEWAHAFPSAPFRADNMGFDCDWLEKMQPFAGHWVKPVELTVGDRVAQGEIGLTTTGIEGSLVYSLSQDIFQGAPVFLNLKPQISAEDLQTRFEKRGKTSIGNFLRKLGLSDAARALYFECRTSSDIAELQNLRLPVLRPRPIDEAISTVGGVKWSALDKNLMLKDKPGVFVAGEMVDWGAPTGGYLLTACLATGYHAGSSALRFIQSDAPSSLQI